MFIWFESTTSQVEIVGATDLSTFATSSSKLREWPSVPILPSRLMNIVSIEVYHYRYVSFVPGVVLLFAPTARPRPNRAIRRLYHLSFRDQLGELSEKICRQTYESAAAIQKPVTTEKKHEIKMVPRRPVHLFRNGEVQQPNKAENA